MDQESITKGILSGIVDRYIREIAQDPNRSIRKLLDMAERTSDGPTQNICYQMMQQMAADQASPYYEMIHHLVTHTDPQTIKNFGINLGHNAWTFGSGNIRQNITKNNTELSWCVIIDRSGTENRCPFSVIRDLIGRGREHDVYAWMLVPSDTFDEWNEYKSLFLDYSDSVFGIILDSEILTEQILEDISKFHNLMILLRTDTEDWQYCAHQLSEKRLLYSVCRKVNNESDMEEILSGDWLEGLVSYHPLMAFTIASDTLSPKTAQTLKTYMWNTRLEQIYSILPADMISDFVIINRLVTHRDKLYRVNPDGSICEADTLQFKTSSQTIENLFV